MARAKKNAGSSPVKFAELPSEARQLASQLTWDPLKMPLLVGSLAGFGEANARNFNDGNWFVGKKQRFARIVPDDSDGDVEYIVYEGGQLNALFNVGEGQRVAIAFTGTEEVEGFKNPVKRYAVGVYD